ncbi:MAG TPA: hypothetical protein VJ201_03190 [Candidatus Babeliales bacterium]|nr:hypothetical protein [Candidatus Babeliales bacterium]
MIITKNLMHKLFITALIMITTTSSHQLNAMKKKSVKISNQILGAEFQSYKLLSTLNNPPFYLLPELVQIIATKVSKLIDKEYYEKHGACLNNLRSLVCFIKHEPCYCLRNYISTINILKRCLRHSSKSLGEIKSPDEKTAFHQISFQCCDVYTNFIFRAKWIYLLRFVAGREAWNVICMKDIYKRTPLHYFGPYFDKYELAALLSAAPNRQKAWDLILTPDINGNTILAMTDKYIHIRPMLELKKYNPEKTKSNKPNLKSYIHDHYKKFSK